jgi:general secretion pathway protein F
MEYQYKALNAQGQPISGQISADGQREAMRLLTSQDLVPLELAEIGPQRQATSSTRKRATHQDKILVIQELATLLESGINLAEAVQSIGETHTDSAVGHSFLKVHAGLRSGEAFSTALRKGAIAWPDYLHQLLLAGEQTGKLGQALRSAASQMEYDRKVRQDIRNALIYPIILVISGLAATLLVFLVVVPKFANILRNTRNEIPEISVWVLKAGMFTKEHLGELALGSGTLLIVLLALLSNPAIRVKLWESLSRLPLVGPWIRETEVGRWAAMLGILLENRVPLLNALALAASGVRIQSVRSTLDHAQREIRGGKKIAEALAVGAMLSPTAINLIRVGERSGQLDQMLNTLARLYGEASQQRLKRFLILIEPIAILLIGGVIGFIIIAIMLAVTSLSNVTL